METYLTRFGSIPGQGTFGEWTIGDLKVKTIEREWLNNRRMVSCIPAGAYQLVPHTRPNGDEVYAVVNETLGIYQYPNDDAVRDLILVHTANKQAELAGCIAPGAQFFGLKYSFAVSDSSLTMSAIKEQLGRERHNIYISWKQYNEL